METNTLISISAVIISIITSYLTSKVVIWKEKKQGKLILFELIKRYFAICFNSWDKNTKAPKTRMEDQAKYLRSIEGIESELSQLVKNSFYSDILIKYPELTMLHLSLISEIEENKSNNDRIILEQGTAVHMYNLYKEIKPKLTPSIKRKESFKSLDNLIIGYMKNKVDDETFNSINNI